LTGARKKRAIKGVGSNSDAGRYQGLRCSRSISGGPDARRSSGDRFACPWFGGEQMGGSMRRVDQGPCSRGFLAWLCGPRLSSRHTPDNLSPPGDVSAAPNEFSTTLLSHDCSLRHVSQNAIALLPLPDPTIPASWIGLRYDDGLQLEATGQCWLQIRLRACIAACYALMSP